MEANFTPMARRSGKPLIFADVAAPAKIILPEIEWRKRPVRKDASPDAGHRVTLSSLFFQSDGCEKLRGTQSLRNGGKPS